MWLNLDCNFYLHIHLLFDMNSLWEEYVLMCLKKATKDEYSNIEVNGQRSKTFWNGITIRPDIVIEKGDETFIIDTKWKNINGSKPSTNDLRQMYVYNDYWKAQKSVLLYPSHQTQKPNFIHFDGFSDQCSIGKLHILEGNKLNDKIGYEILEWF